MSPAKSQALARLLHNPNSRSRDRENPRLALPINHQREARC
jgi:hypothetical protein